MTQKYVNGELVEMTQEELDALAPTAEEIAAREALHAHRTAYQQNFDALKENQQARQLLKATPEQIDGYIETNVTNLASAKEVLKLLAKAVSVLAHEVYK
jgi:hypothetical protein